MNSLSIMQFDAWYIVPALVSGRTGYYLSLVIITVLFILLPIPLILSRLWESKDLLNFAPFPLSNICNHGLLVWPEEVEEKHLLKPGEKAVYECVRCGALN
jgi:hypothetical protein